MVDIERRKKQQREYHNKNRERKNKQRRKRYYKNKEEELKYLKKWKINNPEKALDGRRNWKKKNIIKHKANIRALRKKLIGSCCVQCNSISDLQFHHTDYKNDKGITLCRNCHQELHRKWDIKTDEYKQ